MIKMSATFPKLQNANVLLQVLTHGAQELGQLIKEDFEETTKTWTHKPDFQIVLVKVAEGTLINVFTQDTIYSYVSEGTRPHVIVPKNANWLKFPRQYKAKTNVGIISSTTGGHYGAPTFRKSVQHPGIEARKFAETIAEKYGEIAPRKAQEAVRRAILTAGFSFV